MVASFWHIPVGFTVGESGIHMSLLHWINDALMTIFFFLVGLEIKRELVHGELRDPRNAVLPAAAALGGMVVPAAIYLLLEHGKPGADGWAIPMATDIAFVVEAGKIGTLAGSAVSAVLGCTLLWWFLKMGALARIGG